MSIKFYWNTVSPTIRILPLAALALQWWRWVVMRDAKPKVLTLCPLKSTNLPIPVQFKDRQVPLHSLLPGKWLLHHHHHVALLIVILCAGYLLDAHIGWFLTFSPVPYTYPMQFSKHNLSYSGHSENPKGKNCFVNMPYLPIIFASEGFFLAFVVLSQHLQAIF